MGSRGIANKNISSYKKGGKVKKTGMAKVHKGEMVMNARMVKKMEKLLKS